MINSIKSLVKNSTLLLMTLLLAVLSFMIGFWSADNNIALAGLADPPADPGCDTGDNDGPCGNSSDGAACCTA